jgi:hypothetical protein
LRDIDDDLDLDDLRPIIRHLRRFGIFYAEPLDLDYIMLAQFPAAYKKLEPGETGPHTSSALARVIGDESSDEAFWQEPHRVVRLRWYRYLFLTHSKPSSHLRALGRLTDDQLSADAPKVLTALIAHIRRQAGL